MEMPSCPSLSDVEPPCNGGDEKKEEGMCEVVADRSLLRVAEASSAESPFDVVVEDEDDDVVADVAGIDDDVEGGSDRTEVWLVGLELPLAGRLCSPDPPEKDPLLPLMASKDSIVANDKRQRVQKYLRWSLPFSV